jgi:hypothetical protein
MTDANPTLQSFRRLEAVIRKAASESKLAYEFSANSYTFAAMNACFAAERALECLRDALEAEVETWPSARCYRARQARFHLGSGPGPPTYLRGR